MGVQSWDAGFPATLGAPTRLLQARRSYEILREAGIRNINLDLMFGIPGQSRGQWRTTLEKTIALEPNHISAYCLTYEEDTDYFLRVSSGQYQPDEMLDADLFEMTMDVLEAADFSQYEISNFAIRAVTPQPGLWLGSISAPASAFSLYSDRWKNVSDTSTYVSAIESF
jgi:oxygen-independent coproporphyrinogen-3 oxidase